MQALSSHPVHITDNEGKASPSAFIPFCEFGGNMDTMSINHKNFNWPICNIFKARILDDQLCYEVNLNLLRSQANFHNDIKLGLVFYMDYNEDRQIVLEDIVASINNKSTIVGSVDQSNDDKKGYTYLDTICKSLINEMKFMVSLNKYYRTIQVSW